MSRQHARTAGVMPIARPDKRSTAGWSLTPFPGCSRQGSELLEPRTLAVALAAAVQYRRTFLGLGRLHQVPPGGGSVETVAGLTVGPTLSQPAGCQRVDRNTAAPVGLSIFLPLRKAGPPACAVAGSLFELPDLVACGLDSAFRSATRCSAIANSAAVAACLPPCQQPTPPAIAAAPDRAGERYPR